MPSGSQASMSYEYSMGYCFPGFLSHFTNGLLSDAKYGSISILLIFFAIDSFLPFSASDNQLTVLCAFTTSNKTWLVDWAFSYSF